MDHCCSCGDAAPRAGPDRVAWQDHGLRALNNPPGLAGPRVAALDHLAAVPAGAGLLGLSRPSVLRWPAAEWLGQHPACPHPGGWRPAPPGEAALAVTAVVLLVAGAQRPARRRAAAVTAWVVIPVGIVWLIVAGI